MFMTESCNFKRKQEKKRWLITTLFVFALYLTSCSLSIDEQTSITREMTPIVTTMLPQTSVTTPTSTLEVSPTPTVIPQASPTVAIPTVTLTSTPNVNETVPIHYQCSKSEPVLVEETDLVKGWILRGDWDTDKGVAVLSTTRLNNLSSFFIPDLPDQVIWPYESPNKEWFAYSLPTWDGETISMNIIVASPHTSEEFQTSIERIRLLPYDSELHWINDSQVVIPLMNEDEVFHWIVWSPFNGEQKMLSVELTGLGVLMERFSHPPTLDPLLELVVYPCENCGQTEYAVKNVETGEIAWLIDLGDNPAYDVLRAPVVWSPNGEMVAVLGGELSNQLLFFNRQGEKIYEVVLPIVEYIGTLGAFVQTWSPNSKYLAFLRSTIDAEGNQIESLSYVDLQDGQLIDLCINAHTGTPIWSPDSTKIAFSQQIQSGEQPRLISIIDIDSGDVIQLYDVNAYTLLGWMSLTGQE